MPDFADSNRVGLRRIEEATWGTTPSGPNMKNLNFTSESLKSNINTVTSETIRSDRNVSDITQVGGGAGGDIGFEVRYGDIDDLIAGAMNEAWTTTLVSVSHSAFVSGARLFVGNGSAGNAVVSGQMLRLANSSLTANNGDYRVTGVSVTGASAVIDLADASSGAAASFTSDIFAATTTFKGKNIRNGVTKSSFTIEKEFADVSTFAQYTGMRVTNMGLNFVSQSMLTGTFGFTGKTQAATSTTVASATTAASTNDALNASGNVARIWEGGQAVTGVVFQSVGVELNNNPREQTKVGSDQLAGVGLGRAEVTGSFSAYYENNALLDKFVAGTATNLRFQVTDADGNSYIIDIPKVRLTDQTVTATGANNDIMQDVTWGAMVDDTGTYAIQIDALDA